jgi:multiple sugar transport system substrate-binding protein
VKGLWEPTRPLTPKALRSAGECGFNEKPNAGHQGGSSIALSRYSKQPEAAWVFMQWGCCKEIVTRCTLAGGVAPPRTSSYADPRVKAKAKVGPGTTRHLDAVKWTIDHAMATEPHLPLWASLSTNEVPTELGKLLTGQAYGGDAKQCLDAIASMVDAQVKAAGLL